MPLGCTGNTAAEQGLVELIHFDDLVLHMGCPFGAVVLCCRLSCPDEHVTHPHLAGIALAVVGREVFHELSRKIMLFVHEHSVPWNEYPVETVSYTHLTL